MKKQWFSCCIVFLFIIIAGYWLTASGIGPLEELNNQSKSLTVVAHIEGEPVTLEEFKLKANESRAYIFNYFKQKYDAEDHSEFWTSNYGGEVPRDIMIDKVMEELTRIKVQQLWAMKEGITSDISYSSFLKNLEAENAARVKAVKNNQVIFGPVQYGENEYYQYVFSNIVIQLKKKLGEKGLTDIRYEEDVNRLASQASVQIDDAVLSAYLAAKFRHN